MKPPRTKYTGDEIIGELQRIFRAFPRNVRKRLDAARNDNEKWDALGEELERAAGVPVNYYRRFKSQEELPRDDDGKSTHWEDGSVNGLFVLNKGCTSGRDWNKKLVLACGGEVRILRVMTSVLLPLYTVDCYYKRYDRKSKRYFTGPYRPKGRWELGVQSRVRACLKANGLRPVSKRQCLRIVPGIRTECTERGEATVFDCLFSDVAMHTQWHFSYWDERFPSAPLMRANKVDRLDEYDARGNLKQYWVSLSFGKLEIISARISKAGEIMEVSVCFGPGLHNEALSRDNSPPRTAIWPASCVYKR